MNNVSLSPNIKKLTIYGNIFYNAINWKQSSVRYLDLSGSCLLEDCINLLKNNTQIYKMNIHRSIENDMYKFIKNNPNHSLQYIKSNKFNSNHQNLISLLKNKRINVYNQILTMFLISKSNHKYKKYAPKPIINLILEYMYDIDYLKCTKILI